MAAVDITTTGSLIARNAVELARKIGAKVRLVHVVVIAPQVPPPAIFVPPASFRAHEFIATAERFLRDLEKEIPEDLRDGIEVVTGHAAEQICQLAQRYDPDIVVIGAHEYGLVSRALGTTAARIVNRADRPVLVVRPLPTNHIADREVVAASHA